MLSREELAKKPLIQFILLLSLCLSSTIIFSIIGGLLTVVLYGFDLSNMQNYNDPNVIEGLKLFQLFSAIGLFLVPPFVYAIIASKKPLKKLKLTQSAAPINYLLVILLIVVSTPFLSWIIELNANMVLPDFMAEIERWMRVSENQAEQLTKAFLTFDGFGSLVYILIIVAVVPAVGEELLFRGVLQKILIQWTKNTHLGIWLTAILFSAMHMQFFGFFPRMLLGVVFGYIFYWSKSLWLPILGHFINNASVVLASYFVPEAVDNADISVFEDNSYNITYYLLSFVLAFGVMVLIKRLNSRKKQTLEVN